MADKPATSEGLVSGRGRLEALDRYEIFGSDPEDGFDGLARLAAEICETPTALITFVNGRQQFIKAAVGFSGDRIAPVGAGFDLNVVLERAAVTIPDILADEAFVNTPMERGGTRFYAGVPLVTCDDHVLGALCVLDTQARAPLSDRQRQSLEAIAAQVLSQLELRRLKIVARRETACAEKHARRLSLVAEASALMLAGTDPVDTLRQLFTLIRNGFGVDVGFHYRCGEGALELVAAIGLTRQQEASASRLDFGQTVCGIVANRREPMHVAGIQQSDDDVVLPLKVLGLQSYYSTPLIAGAELLGTISFGRREKDFSSREIEALQTMTSQLATSIERQRAEAELVKSEAELRFALKAGRFGAWRLDLLTGQLMTSETCRTNFGRNPDDPFSYEELRESIHPDDRVRMVAAVENSIATGTDYDIEYRVVTPAGDIRWVAIRAQPSYARDGSPLGMTGVSIDISERKQSEEQLRTLNETLEEQVADRTTLLRRYQEIIESTAMPVVAFDADLRITVFNRAHADAYRRAYGIEQRIGDSLVEQFVPEQAAIVRGFMERALAGETFTVREAFGNPALEVLSWQINYAPLRDDQGTIVGAFHHATDITTELRTQDELNRAQDALRQSQKMEAIGQLTGGVAHDFNNLLTVIRGSVDLLRRDNVPADKRQRYLDAIGDTADRASKLTGQLLAFARRQTLEPEVIDVAQRLDAISDMLNSVTGARVAIAYEVPDSSCRILADVSQFETALVNLAVNARDAMGGEGTITIQLRCNARMPAIRGHGPGAGDFVAVCITDTGVGIANDDLERIFEPFFTTKGVGKGTGLGLSQVFGFAKQSGGDVDVESTVGQGSTFTLYLPQAGVERVNDHPPIPQIQAVDGEGRCVLVVEDNISVGQFATQLLDDLGYRTHWVTSAEEALERLGSDGDGFDIVFTDVVMPGMGGIELARRLARDLPAMPVVLASGYSHVLAQEGVEGLELIRKPYSANQLSTALQRRIAFASAMQA